MNIISFDIEEWYVEKKFRGAREEKYRQYDEMLDKILESLDERGYKATFFCLGRIATDFPHVIKRIAAQGHEIGCHSHEHLWLTAMTPEQLRADTKDAIAALEDVSGQKVESYRAPAFSIGDKNKWALEILAECGITRDASIFPAVRDFGGFASFQEDTPCIIESNGVQIKEFPIPVTKILGKTRAFSGGGYFRFFPLWYIKRELDNRPYGMCYFHIGDLISESKKMLSREEYERYFKKPGTFLNRLKRYIKGNLGTASSFAKMEKLMSSTEFISLKKADELLNWDKTIKI